MDITHKLDKIYMKVYKHNITDTDLSFITSTLKTQCPTNLLIKKFTLEDSNKLYSTIILSTSVKILQIVISQKHQITPQNSEILLIFYDFLFKDFSFQSALCYLEYSRLKLEAIKGILEVLSNMQSIEIKEKIKYYLTNKDDADMYGMNFALLSEKIPNIRNMTCKILNSKKLDIKFLEIIVNYKKQLSNSNLRLIFNLVADKIYAIMSADSSSYQEPMIYLAIISEINTIIAEKNMKLLDFIPDVINEAYLGYMFSLMVDQESIEKVWSILNNHNILQDIIEKLNVVQNILHEENLNLYHSDIYFIKYGVSIIKKIIETVNGCKSFFITHCDSFLNLLWTKLPYDIIAGLFEFTGLLLHDEEIQVKVHEYFLHVEIFNKLKSERSNKKISDDAFFYNPKTLYNVFEEETKNNDYVLTEKAVFLCSKMLICGMFEEQILDYFVVAIKSSNHKIMLTILQRMIDNKQPITENMISNIKSGMEKNSNLCDAFLKFCIKNYAESCMKSIFKFIINNINIMYLIFSSKSEEFFPFISKIDSKEIISYVNNDFFDRISDNPEKGLEYLLSTLDYNSDFSNLIFKNIDFFNKLNGCDVLKLKLYNVLSEKNYDDFEALLESCADNTTHFILPKVYTNEYFYILARIVQRKHENNETFKQYIVNVYDYSLDNLSGYCKYIKTLITCEINVESMVKKLVELNVESENIAELVGFYRVIKKTNISYNFLPKKLSNALLNKIGTFDNNFFIRKFDQATSYEKFMMFFILNPLELNEDVFKLIIKEISSQVNNDALNVENDYLLVQCLDYMVYSSDVSQIIKIFSGIDIPDRFVDPLVRINVKGLMNKEKSMFNIKLIRRASNDLQVKMCVLGFFYKMFDADVLRELVLSLRKNVVDENLDYIFKEMERVDA